MDMSRSTFDEINSSFCEHLQITSEKSETSHEINDKTEEFLQSNRQCAKSKFV